VANASLVRLITPSDALLRRRNRRTLVAIDKRISWYADCLPLSDASDSQKLLPALFPIQGSPYRAHKWRKLWRFSSTHRRQILQILILMLKGTPLTPYHRTAHHLPCCQAAGLSAGQQPAGQPEQALPAAQTAYRTRLATQDPVFRPDRHLRFHTEHCAACCTSSAQSARSRPPRTTTASLRAHTRAHRHHQALARGLLNTCVSLCVGSAMLSARILHVLRLRR